MKYALLVAGIIELTGGLLIYVKPELIFQNTAALSIRFYGLAAMVIGLLCVNAYRDFTMNRYFKNFFLTIMFFQGALSLICYQDQGDGLQYKTGAIISHVIVFIIFVVAYLKDQKPGK